MKFFYLHVLWVVVIWVKMYKVGSIVQSVNPKKFLSLEITFLKYIPMITIHKTCLLTIMWIQLPNIPKVCSQQGWTRSTKLRKIVLVKLVFCRVYKHVIDGHIKKQYTYTYLGERSWEETAISAGKISVPCSNKCPKLSLLYWQMAFWHTLDFVIVLLQ